MLDVWQQIRQVLLIGTAYGERARVAGGKTDAVTKKVIISTLVFLSRKQGALCAYEIVDDGRYRFYWVSVTSSGAETPSSTRLGLD